ncbi:MAG: hypothetical protein AB1668_03400 [Nanoarchaeota archaeon]
MSFKIQIPQIDGKGRDTKDLVINILSTEWPLPIKKIYNEIRKQGKSLTYQAVHKTIVELLSEGTLIKQAKEYSINPDYIKQIKDFGIKLESIYTKRGAAILEDLNRRGFVSLEFEKEIEMGKFLIDLIEDTCEKEDIIYLLWNVIWCPLTFSEREYLQLKKISSTAKIVLLTPVSEAVPIEKVFGDMWKKIGVEVNYMSNFKSIFETIIYKDLIIDVLYPYPLFKHRMAEQSIPLEKTDLDWYYRHILKEKHLTHLTIIKNKKLVEEYKKYVEDIKNETPSH